MNIRKKLCRIRNQLKSWIRNRKNHSGFATQVGDRHRFDPDPTFHFDAVPIQICNIINVEIFLKKVQVGCTFS
jgi:hypothetical protein